MTPSTFHAFAVAVLFTFFFACTSASLQKENAYYSSGAPGTITTTPTTAFHGNAFSKKLAVARSSRHTTLASPNEKKDGFICHTRSGEGEEIECTTASRRTLLSGLWSQIAVASAAAVGVGLVDPRASYAAEGKSIEEVRKGVEADFVSRRYYVTGDLTPGLYRPDCLFTDPTTRVASVDRYTAAVRLLFDPDNAQVDLLSLEVKDENHLFAKWRLQGYLKFPWHPYVAPYTGTTLYTLDSNGLISQHEETWSISALDAARATITPTAGPRKGGSL